MEEEQEEQKWYSGPLKYIIALFLALIIVFMIIPEYVVKYDPYPERVPNITEVFSGASSQKNFSVNQLADFYNYVSTDGEVKKVADKIVSISCENNRVCNAKAVYYFVRDRIEYVNDPGSEFVKEPLYTLEVGAGDCDDHAVLLASLLRSIGFETRFVFITNHVYIQALIPEALKRYQSSGWVNLDSTCSNCEFGELPLTAGTEKQII